MKQKRKLIQSWLILIFSMSACPTSIIGYGTSSSSISVQSSRETESLQLKTVFTTKEDLYYSSSTYFVTVPSPASTPLATTVSSSTESQTTSASPTSIIGYSTSSSSISVRSSKETESLQLETVFTIKEDVPSSLTYFVTVPSPASTPLATTVSSSTESQIPSPASTPLVTTVSSGIESQTTSASPTSIIGYSTSSSSISVQSLRETESLQWKIQSTIKGDSLSSSIHPFTTVSPAVSTVLATTVSSITGPQRPSAPPANVSGHNTSSTSIFVHWDQVPAAHQNGAILYYTVTYRALPSGSVQTRSVSASANQTTLSGLKKYTNYSITVFASTSKGAGNVSAPIFIVTDEDRPSAPPANVSGYNTSSTSIFVQWDQVPAVHQNGVILYYTITYRLYYNGLFPQTVVVDAPTTQTTLTGLFQGTFYSISVSASTSKGNGASSYIYIGTGCAREHIILNGTNGEIIFHSYHRYYYYYYYYQYYRYNRTCSWKIMANTGEQVKLVLKRVEFSQCGFSCSCGHLEIQNGTYGDGSNPTRMCGALLGNVEIYSRVGHGLRIQAVTVASWGHSFWASYTVVSQKDTVADGCSNYIFLNESNRAMTDAGRSLGNLSDSKLSGWYRFSAGAGTQMAEACPKMYSCSTNSSGWLNGTHPTVAEGIVKRKVCFSQRVSQFFNDCCNQEKTISVRNCGAFYVYLLDPPDHYYSRYCGNGLPQAPECSNYKLLDDSSRVATYNHSVLANCIDTTKLIGWYRFGGEAGTQMADTCVTMRHCGARYPGWLSGGHPSVSDGAVLRKVCFTGYQGCCACSTFINVRNCNGFYVYKLLPPVLNNNYYYYYYYYYYNHCYYYYYHYRYQCTFRYCSSNEPPTCSTTAKPSTTDTTETSTTTETTTHFTSNPTPTRPPILIRVNVSEGDDVTLSNCVTKNIKGNNEYRWSREGEGPVETTSRTLEDEKSKLRIKQVAVRDSGIYNCENGVDKYIFTVTVSVLVKVEMVMKVLSFKYTPELQNKSSPVYKETERNFTKVMDKVFQNTPGYQRTEVLNFTKGSVKVDFRVIIVVVATDPKNASSIVDKGAETGQQVVRQAKSGTLPGIKVDPVVEVKGPPPEPLNVTVFDKKSDQLSVQWLPPEETTAFGIYGYVVQHWRFATKDVFAKYLKAPEGKSEFSYQIQNLEPDTSYVIRVAAENNYGMNFNEETAYQTRPLSLVSWVIALIGIAVAFLIALIIGVTICLRLTTREKREQQHGERQRVPEEMHLYADDMLRDRRNERGSKFSFVNASFKPTEVNWTEIPYENINLMDEIGSGAFGVVYKGEILRGKNDVTPCAVKTLKASATDEEVRDLYNELEIMTNVGKHPNLVNLIGACTGNGKLLVVLEIAENGSLLEFLKRRRSKNEGYEGEGTATGSALPGNIKLRISLDVARGMAHLSKHRCIHRDLAARNVLLGENLVAKVADYGMARDVYEQLMYKKETQGKLPVKWMAIESLETYVFTLESDVWSYGVLLWEIESGGVKPYPGLTATELMSELKKGYRLEKPNGCSDAMYQLMRSCWHPKPKLRPSFDELVERLEMSVSS